MIFETIFNEILQHLFNINVKPSENNCTKTFLGENLVNLICDYVRIPKVRLRMSTEGFQRAVLDYSQDGRQIVQNVNFLNYYFMTG